MLRRMNRRAVTPTEFSSIPVSRSNALDLPDPASPRSTYPLADRKSDSLSPCESHLPSRHRETVRSTSTMGLFKPIVGGFGQKLVERHSSRSHYKSLRTRKAPLECLQPG